MPILSWLVSKLTSGLLSTFGNAVLKPILDHLTAKDDAHRDIAIAQIGADQAQSAAIIAAEIQANNAKAALAPQFKGLIYAIGIPPTIHFGCYCLSAAFDLGWSVRALPSEMIPVEATILTAFFISSPLTMLARGVTARITK